MTIKECFDLAGTATTYGLTTRRNDIESADDPYVAALRAAGAIPIAKTNLPQLMFYTETDNPLYGRTNNPWDLERSCGGSSGGEAAVIGAGASPLGLGNDIGGSLRIPAAFCGITSIRPTAGRLPDHCATDCRSARPPSSAKSAPMARYVEDLVMGLRVLDHARDPSVDPAPQFGDPSSVDLSRLRFATFTDDGEFPVAPAVKRAVAEAAQISDRSRGEGRRLGRRHRRAGRLTCCLPPSPPTPAQPIGGCCAAIKVDRRLRPLLLIAAMPLWLRGVAGLALDGIGQRRLARNLRRFAPGTADAYWLTVEAIANFRRELLQSLDNAGGGPADLILCPAYALPPIRHGATEMMPMPGAYIPLANVTWFSGGRRAGHPCAGERRKRPRAKPRPDRARGARNRTRQRRLADRGANHRPAVA